MLGVLKLAFSDSQELAANALHPYLQDVVRDIRAWEQRHPESETV